MLISKTKKVFIITFNAPNKEREKLIFCVRFLMRYCENAETEASFIIYRKVSNNNYFYFWFRALLQYIWILYNVYYLLILVETLQRYWQLLWEFLFNKTCVVYYVIFILSSEYFSMDECTRDNRSCWFIHMFNKIQTWDF